MGCGVDLPFEHEEPELPEFPPFDITGSWLLSVLDARPSILPTPDTLGTCISDEFPITLTYEGPSETHFDYSGSHGDFSMVCSGVDEPATQVFNLTDTVIVVAAGSIQGEMHYETCVWNPLTGCRPEWLFGLDLADFRFEGFAGADPISGWFHWPPYSDTARVFGRWSGHRSPPPPDPWNLKP